MKTEERVSYNIIDFDEYNVGVYLLEDKEEDKQPREKIGKSVSVSVDYLDNSDIINLVKNLF